MTLSIIIFCHNEQETLRSVTENALLFLQRFAPNSEIIIVDDGSTDRSSAIAKALAEEYQQTVRAIHHSQNMGIGMALRTGYTAAQMEYVCAIPADGQFDINQLNNIEAFNDNTYYSFYRRTTGYTFYRYLLTWLNRLYNQHILGIYLRDVNWIKVYRLSQLERVQPRLTSSIIESEICAKLKKLDALPIEIPSEYLQRQYGISKGGSVKTVWRALSETWKLFWVVRGFEVNAK